MFAQDVVAVKDKAVVSTTWDAEFFYISFKVDSPEVRGTHTAPNDEVAGDDLVEVYLEAGNARANKITTRCAFMAVSAAGGSQFRIGNDAGVLEPVAIWSFRYGAAVQGTINNNEDVDMGYSVEMAIPWEAMKIQAPKMGDMIGFNVVVRRAGAKQGEFTALAADVKTEDDVLNPSRWSKVVFAPNSFGAATTTHDKVVSAKYIVRSPLINGQIEEKEWHKNTGFFLDLPMPKGVTYQAKFPSQKTILARYEYVFDSLLDHPLMGMGPWFAADRVQWHKSEMIDSVSAGIDVLLPTYDLSDSKNIGMVRRGLDCMVAAAAELKSEGKAYPRIAMCLDAASLKASGDAAATELYDTVSDFYDRVPTEFTMLVQAGKPNLGRIGCLVYVYSGDGKAALDPAAVQACGDRYLADYGRPLVWVGGANGFPDNERISHAEVTPGNRSAAGPVIERLNGRTYDKSWADAIAKKPTWIVIDSWNDFSTASQITATREYGRKYIDATLANAKRFLGVNDYRTQYLSVNCPAVVEPKRIAQVEVELRNAGNVPWRATEGYALAYRWYKNGRYYGESKIRRPIEKDVLPGDTVRMVMGIATVNAQGDAIPEGDCEMRLEMLRLSDGKWFSTLGDQPLMVPLSVGNVVEFNASYLTSSMPSMVATGREYPVKVRVRNDGNKVWTKGVTKLAAKLFRTMGDNAEEEPIKEIKAALDSDCNPGEIAEFEVHLNLLQPDRKNIEAWSPGEKWNYVIKYDLNTGSQLLSDVGVKALSRIIEVHGKDYGPRIVDCDIPSIVSAGETVETRVVLRNAGKETWDRKRTRLGCHWYHLDGSEMIWEGDLTPIPANVQPGMPLIMTAKVIAPITDGQYILVWDIKVDDKWLSGEPLLRGGDMLPVFIQVTGGNLVFSDLTRIFDTAMTSPDTERTTGDFDGKGLSFPAELVPPDASPRDGLGNCYPTGYKVSREPQPDGRISFLYPDNNTGSRNAVACAGQKALFDHGQYKTLHILGASIKGEAEGELSINYTDGAEPAQIKMSDWSSGPAYKERIGLAVSHRHSHGGNVPGAAYLYHYILRLDASRTLTSVTLPKNSDMRVVAVTAEK